MCVYLNHSAVQHNLMQQRKSTIVQLNKLDAVQYSSLTPEVRGIPPPQMNGEFQFKSHFAQHYFFFFYLEYHFQCPTHGKGT